jgi:AcrR family transcriptional regulator
MENQTLSRKERERLSKKKEILDAAIKLFATKGFVQTTLDEIAEAAEFGKGTLYNYFTNKDEIFSSIIDSVSSSNVDCIVEADSQAKTFKEFIWKYTMNTFNYCANNKEAFILLVGYFIDKLGKYQLTYREDPYYIKHRKIEDILVHRIKSAIHKKEIKPLNPTQFFMLYHNLVFPYILDLINHEGMENISIEEHTSFIIDVLFNGIHKN